MTRKSAIKTSPCPLQRGTVRTYPPLEGAGGGENGLVKKIIISLIAFLLLCNCDGKQKSEDIAIDFPEIIEKGEITAVTLYGSTSYFQFKLQLMGYEYELIADFAKQHQLKLNIIVAENESHLIEILQSGEADIVAYPILIDSKLKQEALFCGHERQSHLVIIQRTNPKDSILQDVTQLIGKEVYVKSNTRYHHRLANLNGELGGGIHILPIENDSISTEDLIEMVSKGRIPYTVCEDDVARLNRTYFRNIDINLEISFKQRSSWIVRNNSPLLADTINGWASNNKGLSTYDALLKRYFERSKDFIPILNSYVPRVSGGQISPYDHLFKKYAPLLNWDWQLLASIAYQESLFNPSGIAWTGAEGLMGIMPATAENFGFDPEDMQDPEKSIQAGVECLRQFGKGFTEAPDSLEQVKLTLASYNAGIGHVFDARQLALKYGKNPDVWNDNVAEFILLKSEPYYYTDSVCNHGYLRGKETYNYVEEVLERYYYYKSATEND
jgi:membrane-bound lytic murein transglycosylase F